MAKRMNPLLPLLGLGAALFALTSSKKSAAATPGGGSSTPAAPSVPTVPATPAPSGATRVPVTINGHPWVLVPITGQNVGTVDVYAPAGSWGPHAELRVCRFTQATSESPRVLAGVAEGVPKQVLDAAMADLDIRVPQSGPAATATTPAGRPPMPSSLQQEMVAVMAALGVDAAGVVRGPVTAEAIRRATELSSRLEQAGYPEAASQLRSYAQAASRMLPPPGPATPQPPAIPGVPAELMARIQQALQLERDPAKLEALKAALLSLPPSAERDLLIGALDALILQVRAAQAVSQAATEIDEQMKQGPALPALPASPRVLKLTSPLMTGPDVAAWQQVLIASGYTKIKPDGVFGPATDAATKDWQSKRGLTVDGDVGPLTLAKVGTPPTAPLSVPANSSPQPDPKPKTAVQVAADALATHLLALQGKHGVSGSKGREDKSLVKRFQSAVGGVADGLTGPNTILALAKNGIGVLPMVMYWSKTATKAKDLPAFRSNLKAIAASARAAGNATLATQIEASAARESGAGGLK